MTKEELRGLVTFFAPIAIVMGLLILAVRR